MLKHFCLFFQPQNWICCLTKWKSDVKLLWWSPPHSLLKMQILVVGAFPVWIRDLWTGLHNALRAFFLFFSDSTRPSQVCGCVETWGSVMYVMIGPQDWATFSGSCTFPGWDEQPTWTEIYPYVIHWVHHWKLLTEYQINAAGAAQTSSCETFLCVPKARGANLGKSLGDGGWSGSTLHCSRGQGLNLRFSRSSVGAEGLCQPEIIPIRGRNNACMRVFIHVLAWKAVTNHFK